MDESWKTPVEKLSITDRMELADKLEEQAKQLREFKQKEVPFIGHVVFQLRPNVKRALLYFAKGCGAKDSMDESAILSLGARWFLEYSLPLMQKVIGLQRTCSFYRHDEGVDESHLTESNIAKVMDELESKKVS
jgi:hypothetical protein